MFSKPVLAIENDNISLSIYENGVANYTAKTHMESLTIQTDSGEQIIPINGSRTASVRDIGVSSAYKVKEAVFLTHEDEDRSVKIYTNNPDLDSDKNFVQYQFHNPKADHTKNSFMIQIDEKKSVVYSNQRETTNQYVASVEANKDYKIFPNVREEVLKQQESMNRG